MRILIVPAAAVFLVIAAPALAKMPGEIGIRAGASLASIGGEFGNLFSPGTTEDRVAPSVALVYEHRLAPKLSFHGELGYSGKGLTVKSESTDEAGNATTFKGHWRLDYLEVPLLLRGRFGAGGKPTPFFELGPSVGIALSGEFEDDPSFIGRVDLKHDMKTFDFGWGAGAGVEFPAGPGRIGIEARFTRGFSDLFDTAGGASAINQVWTFALSYAR